MNQYDLFEELRLKLGLAYISDLRFPPNRHRAIALLQQMELKNHSLTELSDLAIYIVGVDKAFETYEEAEAFFICWQETAP